MEYALLGLIGLLAIYFYSMYNSSKANQRIKKQIELAETNEEKLVLLQQEANKSLRGIDGTLAIFFWFFLIGLVLFVFYYLFVSASFI